ncbi:MAG: YggS family pyridoxal phosphate-dependent enzyme [Actinobacteria bacterium]|nr:YggS family pyridoxal phosphate-dependent enzyme [Actinomycetota bacterium]
MSGTNRIDELRLGLATTQERIDHACQQAGRSSNDVTVVVVTKTYPVSDVEILQELGVTDVGENKDQEAGPKRAQMTHPGLRWHAVGQVQSNKAKSVAQWADVVHSVDRVGLVQAFDRVAASSPIQAFVQVSLDGDPARGGCVIPELAVIAEAVARSSTLSLVGVMAVAPLEMEPSRAFADLWAASQGLQGDFPQAAWISAGMTQDFEAAIAAGATHVRIGSAILGNRA